MATIVYAEGWDVDDGTPDNGSAYSRVTSPVYDGAGALRINPSAAQGYWLKNASGSPSIVVLRVWVRFGTLPSVDLPYFLVPYMGAGGNPAVGYDQSSAQFVCAWNGGMGTPGGPTITTGTWYRIDAKFDCSTTTVAVDAQVDGTALTQHTDTTSVGACTDYRLGDFATSDTWDAYFDHFDVSHTAGDYPLGPLGRTYRRLYGPAQLAGTAADLYTCPADTVARVLGIHASNPSGSPVDINLSIGADAAATRIFEDYAVPADGIVRESYPYELAAGEKLQGWADSAGTVVLSITGYEDPV